MFTRFGLIALMLTVATGCEDEAKAGTAGGTSYDDSEVLERDSEEAGVQPHNPPRKACASGAWAVPCGFL